MIQPSQKSERITATVGHSEPVVLCTADDRYAMPLAVTLLTAAETITPGHLLQVFLVDDGFSEQSRSMLKETLAGLPIEVIWVPIEDVQVDDLAISHHISHAAYLRLFADRWLPDSIDKVIYLDSDLLIRESLTGLWNLDLGQHSCLAVPDIACPYINARLAPSNFRRFSPYLAVFEPIRNYRDFGLTGREHYFNSGVLVMNLALWRSEQLGTRLLECLRSHREHVWCWDQYALNALLAGRWGRLPLRWNAGSHAFEYPTADHCPLDREEFESMLRDPAIIHYTTEFKPWDYDSRHPWRDQFFAALDRTAWRHWRPHRPPFRFSQTWQKQAVYWTRQWTIAYRKLAALRAPN